MGENVEKPSKVTELLLCLGLLAGLGSAAAGLQLQGSGLSKDMAARVGGSHISQLEWRRAVAAVAQERRSALTPADERQILDRLIDEELLVQQGLALGLAERDRRLRGQLVQQVMAMAAADVAAVSEADGQRYYAEHPEAFTPPAALRAQALSVQPLAGEAPAQTAARAARLRERLATGEPLAADAGLALPLLPDALLPPAKLVTYLGPSAAEALAQLKPGETAPLLANGEGYWLLRLLARSEALPRPYAELRSAVLGELKRQKEEAAVRKRLTELRQQQAVVTQFDE